MYKVKIENFYGSVSTVNLTTKEQVEEFISVYPSKLPIGTALKVSCDLLGIRGTLRGTK